MVRHLPFPRALPACHYTNHILTDCFLVKFDTPKLPAILNSLEVDNHGSKLVLEVSVYYAPKH